MDLLSLLVYALATALGLYAVKRQGAPGLFAAACLLSMTGLGLAAAAPMLGGTVFGSMRALSWGAFLAAPLGLLGSAWLLRSPGSALGGLLLAAVGVDAFLVEPTRLEVSHNSVVVDGLTQPMRVVVVADLQTDQVGDFEREALRAALDQEPDLVLFPGDYLQLPPDRFIEESVALNQLLHELGFGDVPFVAVRGDVDRDGWQESFAGLGGHVLTATSRVSIDGLTITALSPWASRDPDLVIQPVEGPHLVMGHAPDFALTRPPAQVLVAGHTHGGQVQLPLIGPLMTLTRVPRDQASGYTELDWGAHLFVSRGVGMERRDAPRLRLLCRPEVMVIDLLAGPQA